MYGCESWTVKKAEHRRIDAFELWCWRRLLRVPWAARRSNQSILKDLSKILTATLPEDSGVFLVNCSSQPLRLEATHLSWLETVLLSHPRPPKPLQSTPSLLSDLSYLNLYLCLRPRLCFSSCLCVHSYSLGPKLWCLSGWTPQRWPLGEDFRISEFLRKSFQKGLVDK